MKKSGAKRNFYNTVINNFEFHQVFALVVRLMLIAYGDFHDRRNTVGYTDVDYHVITDGARHVSLGQSPFLRHTYRYTPFLSWLVLPNIILHRFAGKVIFSVIDCLAGTIIFKTLLLQGYSKTLGIKCSLLWLYNPIVIGISTRGSPESLIVSIVLLVVYFHQLNKPNLSGLALGVAIHLKIYPMIYCLPLYLSLEEYSSYTYRIFLPTTKRVQFTVCTVVSFLTLTLCAYLLYGDKYIEEGFLYHITRVDTRHNFSIYFYLLYLAVDFNIPGLSLVTFAPQFLLVAAYGIMYGTKDNLVLSMFAQTVAFVTYNKVVTSQYFVWYLVFLPLLFTKIQMSKRKRILLPCLWLFAQCSWLLPAYLFEFRGINVFLPIWLESVAFFCCNIGILMSIISSYSPTARKRKVE